MAGQITGIMLTIIGIVHLLPVSGALSVERLVVLYGVTVTDANIEVLLRHRAVLFGLLGAVFLLGAWVAQYQGLALALALVSILSFIYLAANPALATAPAQVGVSGVAALTSELRRVNSVDLVLLGCWLVGAGAFAWQRWNNLN